ncbi:MAG: hypothetical protein AMXMBFR80_20120 [Dehalococcoidia bacterium]
MIFRKFMLPTLAAAMVAVTAVAAIACGDDDDDEDAPAVAAAQGPSSQQSAGQAGAPSATAAADAEPYKGKKLRFGLLPSEDAEKVLTEAKHLEGYLEEALPGLAVDLFIGPSYATTIEAMKEGSVDFAYFGPFSYYIARETGAKAESAIAFQEGTTTPGYYSIIYARKSTGITSLDSLKGKETSVNWALVDPGSTSGNLAPRGMMFDAGLDVGAIDTKLVYAGGHDKSAIATANNQTQVGASYEAMLYDLCKKGIIPGIKDVAGGGQTPGDCGDPNADGALVLLRKFLLPASPIAYRSTMDEKLSKAVIDALLTWHEKDPEGFAKFAEITDGKTAKDTKMVAYDHSNFTQIEAMCSRPELKDVCPKK